MIRFAIVEDTQSDFDLLSGYMDRYAQENALQIQVTRFTNGLNFIEEYKPEFDIIFMDIEMPHLNGMDAAHRLREIDMNVAIIFVTNMMQYAIQGYEVNAIDFIVKPVTYFNFAQKLKKALVRIGRNEERTVVLKDEDHSVVVDVKDIYYVEKDKNYLVYHTAKGQFRERGTLQEALDSLADAGFSKCYTSVMVNLAHVAELGTDTLTVHGDVLPVSRRQKKDFMLDFTKYHRGGL